MDLLLNEIVAEFGTRFQLELVAGTDGTTRPMRWVYVTEDYTTSDFLRGGELVITTGMISGGHEDWLLCFLQRMLAKNTCGLILNLGPYMTRNILTSNVCEFCDRNKYPLFVMPWHIHIYDVTRICYEQIYLRTRKDETLQAAFESLLSQREVNADIVHTLEEAGFPSDGTFLVSALHIRNHTRNIFSSLVFNQEISCYPLFHEQECIIVSASDDYRQVYTFIRRIIAQFPDCTAGIGDCVGNIKSLRVSYRHASDALHLGIARQQSVTAYDDLGLFRILMDVSDRSVLYRYCEDYLAPVREYDDAHQSNLAQTLYLYLLYSGSIQMVAEQSFCHRNTVNHRLRILKERLGYTFENASQRFELMSAFLVDSYLKAMTEGEEQK